MCQQLATDEKGAHGALQFTADVLATAFSKEEAD